MAEIEVDPDTFEVRPLKLTAVQEFGRPIHPALAQGQIEGGTAQGLGYALLERVVMRNGAMANSQLTNYTIPTTLDMPELDVVMMENPYPGGPFGAKGLGELPMDGPAPAVVNALRHMGLDVREIPATPELLSAGRPDALHAQRREHRGRVAPDEPPARRAARGVRTHRHQGRMRRGRVRRLHRSRERGARLLLPDSRSAGRKRRRGDDRGAGETIIRCSISS